VLVVLSPGHVPDLMVDLDPPVVTYQDEQLACAVSRLVTPWACSLDSRWPDRSKTCRRMRKTCYG
jgi:hypothetical protein